MGADFIDQIRELSEKIKKQREQIQTEEACKNAFVLPFINALGYNVFDPTEVVPEFTCDIGVKKGEKVDYAVMMDGKPIMLIECKWCGVELDKAEMSQLLRYFSVAAARIGVLTNGIVYRFYTDLDETNKMDQKPYLEFDMLNVQEHLVPELKKLSKAAFNLDDLLSTATDLKYTHEIKRTLADQANQPSEDFVRFLAGQVYAGVKTRTVMEQFAKITKTAFRQFVNDQINNTLKSAIAQQTEPPAVSAVSTPPASSEQEDGDKEARIVTTESETEAFYIAKSILREVVDPRRITPRDFVGFFGVLLDDSKKKPLCRFYFNSTQKYIGLISEDKREERVPIEHIDDIYTYRDRIVAAVRYYEPMLVGAK